MSSGPSHSPRSVRKEAYVVSASSMIPAVCGSKNSAPNPRTACSTDSRGGALCVGCAGSCTFQKISSQASAAKPASTAKPMRQDDSCTSHASGVPVNNMPSPPTPMATPETIANRLAGK
ncbi:hypothetical protein D3C71_1409530 [compost metagenome]